MNRRTFLTMLAGVPFAHHLRPSSSPLAEPAVLRLYDASDTLLATIEMGTPAFDECVFEEVSIDDSSVKIESFTYTASQ